MNFDLLGNMSGSIMRERENYLQSSAQNLPGDAAVPRFPENTPLAMAYVPFQQWGEVYDEDDALCAGTLFPALDLPFGRGGTRNE